MVKISNHSRDIPLYRSDPFNRIKDEKKKVEIRNYEEKRRKVKENDIIEFTNQETNEVLQVKVIKLKLFKTFKELFDYYDNSYLGHDSNDIISYERMYDYYSIDEEKEYGVVGIEIKLIKGDE